MADSITRSQLKEQFLAGSITPAEFHAQLDLLLTYRGYHYKPGQNPQWSGPARSDRDEADDDNAPWFNNGYQVGIYTEQT